MAQVESYNIYMLIALYLRQYINNMYNYIQYTYMNQGWKKSVIIIMIFIDFFMIFMIFINKLF